uniref:G_PROTEIN_RECEP_F1_2 domain-containing protein n=1 Tax=Macrostomum lignano TaxID=282301 RepID=A0A1I8IJL9_9PLAT
IRRHRSSIVSTSSGNQARRDRQFVIHVLAIIVGFMVCWTPYSILAACSLLSLLHIDSGLYLGLSTAALLLAKAGMATSALAYFAVNAEFRSAFASTPLGKRLGCVPANANHGVSMAQQTEAMELRRVRNRSDQDYSSSSDEDNDKKPADEPEPESAEEELAGAAAAVAAVAAGLVEAAAIEQAMPLKRLLAECGSRLCTVWSRGRPPKPLPGAADDDDEGAPTAAAAIAEEIGRSIGSSSELPRAAGKQFYERTTLFITIATDCVYHYERSRNQSSPLPPPPLPMQHLKHHHRHLRQQQQQPQKTRSFKDEQRPRERELFDHRESIQKRRKAEPQSKKDLGKTRTDRLQKNMPQLCATASRCVMGRDRETLGKASVPPSKKSLLRARGGQRFGREHDSNMSSLPSSQASTFYSLLQFHTSASLNKVITMATSLPTLGQLLPSTNIEIFLERLEQYFICKEVKDEAKVATLITSIGEEAYITLRSLCQPVQVAQKSYADLKKLLTTHFAPKPSELAARFRFQQRTQQAGESFTAFIAGLQALSADCNFGESLNERLRDQLVFGLRSDAYRAKLLEVVEPTFESLQTKAMSLESAERSSLEMSQRASESVANLQFVSKRGSRKQVTPSAHHRGHRSAAATTAAAATAAAAAAAAAAATAAATAGNGGGGSSCKSCGGSHERHSCKFRDAKCHACGKVGHIRKVCQSTKQAKLHMLQEERMAPTVEGACDTQVPIFAVRPTGRNAGPTVMLLVNGQECQFVIDTGSAVTLMPQQLQQNLLPQLQLAPSAAVLRTFTNERFHPRGQATVCVQHNAQQLQLPLLVVDKGDTALLGRDWLAHLGLDWPTIMAQVHAVSTDYDISDLHERFAALLIGRRLRSRLDLLTPSLTSAMQQRQQHQLQQQRPARQFQPGDRVLYRDFSTAARAGESSRWAEGVIVNAGTRNCTVDSGRGVQARHADQLLAAPAGLAESNSSTTPAEDCAAPDAGGTPASPQADTADSANEAPRRYPTRVRAPPDRLMLQLTSVGIQVQQKTRLIRAVTRMVSMKRPISRNCSSSMSRSAADAVASSCSAAFCAAVCLRCHRQMITRLVLSTQARQRPAMLANTTKKTDSLNPFGCLASQETQKPLTNSPPGFFGHGRRSESEQRQGGGEQRQAVAGEQQAAEQDAVPRVNRQRHRLVQHPPDAAGPVQHQQHHDKHGGQLEPQRGQLVQVARSGVSLPGAAEISHDPGRLRHQHRQDVRDAERGHDQVQVGPLGRRFGSENYERRQEVAQHQQRLDPDGQQGGGVVQQAVLIREGLTVGDGAKSKAAELASRRGTKKRMVNETDGCRSASAPVNCETTCLLWLVRPVRLHRDQLRPERVPHCRPGTAASVPGPFCICKLCPNNNTEKFYIELYNCLKQLKYCPEPIKARVVTGDVKPSSLTKTSTASTPAPIPKPTPTKIPITSTAGKTVKPTKTFEAEASSSPEKWIGLAIGLSVGVIGFSCLAIWWLCFEGHKKPSKFRDEDLRKQMLDNAAEQATVEQESDEQPQAQSSAAVGKAPNSYKRCSLASRRSSGDGSNSGRSRGGAGTGATPDLRQSIARSLALPSKTVVHKSSFQFGSGGPPLLILRPSLGHIAVEAVQDAEERIAGHLLHALAESSFNQAVTLFSSFQISFQPFNPIGIGLQEIAQPVRLLKAGDQLGGVGPDIVQINRGGFLAVTKVGLKIREIGKMLSHGSSNNSTKGRLDAGKVLLELTGIAQSLQLPLQHGNAAQGHQQLVLLAQRVNPTTLGEFTVNSGGKVGKAKPHGLDFVPSHSQIAEPVVTKQSWPLLLGLQGGCGGGCGGLVAGPAVGRQLKFVLEIVDIDASPGPLVVHVHEDGAAAARRRSAAAGGASGSPAGGPACRLGRPEQRRTAEAAGVAEAALHQAAVVAVAVVAGWRRSGAVDAGQLSSGDSTAGAVAAAATRRIGSSWRSRCRRRSGRFGRLLSGFKRRFGFAQSGFELAHRLLQLALSFAGAVTGRPQAVLHLLHGALLFRLQGGAVGLPVLETLAQLRHDLSGLVLGPALPVLGLKFSPSNSSLLSNRVDKQAGHIDSVVKDGLNLAIQPLVAIFALSELGLQADPLTKLLIVAHILHNIDEPGAADHELQAVLFGRKRLVPTEAGHQGLPAASFANSLAQTVECVQNLSVHAV